MTVKKFNQDEMRAYNEAFDAFEAFMWGAPQEGNPYRRGTGKREAWAEGWKEAVANHREKIEVANRDANTVGYY